MNNLFKILFVSLTISVISCQQNKEQEIKNNSLAHLPAIEVTLEAVIPEDDNFSLYYTTDGSINFDQSEPIWLQVKGMQTVQKVTYKLPENVVNTQLRLDFGMNPKQKEIVLRKITIANGQKYFAVDGEEIFRYFRPDYSKCKVERKTGRIIPIEKDGVRQSPSLYPNEKLLAKELEKLTRQ